MSTVAILPTRRARFAHAAANPRNRDTCGLYDVAGKLGQAHRDLAWLRRYVDGLIAAAGFPAPFPLVRSGALTTAVHADSRWPIVAIETWFDGQLPPAARGAVDRAERERIDHALATSAESLFA